MTEAEWLKSSRPHDLFQAVVRRRKGARRGHRRKCILVGSSCCRNVPEIMADETFRRAIELSERDADRYVITSELTTLCEGLLSNPGHFVTATSRFRIGYSAVLATWRADAPAVLACTGDALTHCALLRCIFGNPFRPVTFSPSWRTSTAVALAAQMYDARDFGAMPILADALQDAGCDSADVLDHCRGPGPHVRGCWVVDLVLGKE